MIPDRPLPPVGAQDPPRAAGGDDGPGRRTLRPDLRRGAVPSPQGATGARLAARPRVRRRDASAPTCVGCDPGRQLMRRQRGLPYGKAIAATFPAFDPPARSRFVQARYLDADAAGRKYDNPAAALAPTPASPSPVTPTAPPTRGRAARVRRDARRPHRRPGRLPARRAARRPDPRRVGRRPRRQLRRQHRPRRRVDVATPTTPGATPGDRLADLLAAEHVDPIIVEPPADLTDADGAPVVDLNAWAQLDPDWATTSLERRSSTPPAPSSPPRLDRHPAIRTRSSTRLNDPSERVTPAALRERRATSLTVRRHAVKGAPRSSTPERDRDERADRDRAAHHRPRPPRHHQRCRVRVPARRRRPAPPVAPRHLPGASSPAPASSTCTPAAASPSPASCASTSTSPTARTAAAGSCAPNASPSSTPAAGHRRTPATTPRRQRGATMTADTADSLSGCSATPATASSSSPTSQHPTAATALPTAGAPGSPRCGRTPTLPGSWVVRAGWEPADRGWQIPRHLAVGDVLEFGLAGDQRRATGTAVARLRAALVRVAALRHRARPGRRRSLPRRRQRAPTAAANTVAELRLAQLTGPDIDPAWARQLGDDVDTEP